MDVEKAKDQPARLRDIKNLVGETDTSLFSSNIFSKELLSRMKMRVEQSEESAQQASVSATRCSSKKTRKTRKQNVDAECDSDEDCVVVSQSSTRSTRRSPTKRSRRSAMSAAVNFSASQESNQSCDEIQPSKETLQILQKLQRAENVGTTIDLSDDSSTDSLAFLGETLCSPVKKEKLMIIVKCQSRLLNYSTSPESTFSDILEKVAEEFEVDASQVKLLFNGWPVRPEDTPESLNLATADILEGIITKYWEMGKAKNMICIKFQCSNKRKNENIEVSLVKPLKEGAELLAEKLGVPLSRLTFRFDGETVDLKSTPQEIGIEDDDCVDVCIH